MTKEVISKLDRLLHASGNKALPVNHLSWSQPMLATLTANHFSSPNWIYERKLDGQRCIAERYGTEVKLFSRNKEPLNINYPEIVSALEAQGSQAFVVDGEIVAFAGSETSFAKLQPRMQARTLLQALISQVPVYYYIFDVLFAEGYDLQSVPLRQRKAILRELLSYKDPLRYTVHRNGKGLEYYQQAVEKGWEGVIAKKADSTYTQARSGNWLKFKCVLEQEFVIGGYTDPQGSRTGFGALLLGFYDSGKLIYAGKVGTGFNENTLSNLAGSLRQLETEQVPFGHDSIVERGVHWVKPQLVCQIGFAQWTQDNKLRHPRFLGLRQDKEPKAVVKEQ